MPAPVHHPPTSPDPTSPDTGASDLAWSSLTDWRVTRERRENRRRPRPPSVTLSILVHIALLLVLSLVDLGLRTAHQEADVPATLQSDAPALSGHLEELPRQPAEADLSAEAPRRDAVAVDAEFAGSAASSAVAPSADRFESIVTPSDLTERPVQPTADAIAAATSSVVGVGGNAIHMGQSFGKDGAAGAISEVGGALAGDPYAGRVLKKVRSGSGGARILVLQGEFDAAEDVLAELGIQYLLLDPAVLATTPIPAETRALIVDCSPHPLPAQALRHIVQFVERGGYLFTTDWGIETVLDRAFRQYVQCRRDGKRVAMLKERVVNVRAVSDHALLRGVPDGKRIARWWLEDSTIPVTINHPSAVEILLECRALALTHDAPAAALTFRHGRGRVAHVLGHVYQKEGNLRGVYVVHRLLLNFLRESLSAR